MLTLSSSRDPPLLAVHDSNEPLVPGDKTKKAARPDCEGRFNRIFPCLICFCYPNASLAIFLAAIWDGYVGYCDANAARQPNEVMRVLSEHSRQLGLI